MLTCKEQVARSSDYLDGQLTFRERLLVRHHLMFCPNCRRFIRQMRELGLNVQLWIIGLELFEQSLRVLLLIGLAQFQQA